MYRVVGAGCCEAEGCCQSGCPDCPGCCDCAEPDDKSASDCCAVSDDCCAGSGDCCPARACSVSLVSCPGSASAVISDRVTPPFFPQDEINDTNRKTTGKSFNFFLIFPPYGRGRGIVKSGSSRFFRVITNYAAAFNTVLRLVSRVSSSSRTSPPSQMRANMVSSCIQKFSVSMSLGSETLPAYSRAYI